MGADIWQDIVKSFLLQLLVGCPWSEEESKAKFCLICAGDMYAGLVEEQSMITPKMKECILETAGDAITTIRYLAAICRLLRKIQRDHGIYKKSGEETETQKYWVASTRKALLSISQIMHPTTGVLAKYISASGSSAIFSTSEQFATIAEEDESAELQEDATAHKLRFQKCRYEHEHRGKNAAVPLTHGLTRCVLSFSEHFFAFGPRYSKFFEQEWSLFYVRTHYLSFVKLYTISTCAEEGSATIRLASSLCKLHLRCLISIARNRSEDTSRDFFKFHCVEFLAREVDLEYKSTLYTTATVPGRDEVSPKQEIETPQPSPSKAEPVSFPLMKVPKKFKLSLDLSKLGFKNGRDPPKMDENDVANEAKKAEELGRSMTLDKGANKSMKVKKTPVESAFAVGSRNNDKKAVKQSESSSSRRIPAPAVKNSHFAIKANPVLNRMLTDTGRPTLELKYTNTKPRKSRTFVEPEKKKRKHEELARVYVPSRKVSDTIRHPPVIRAAKPEGRSLIKALSSMDIRRSKTFTTALISPRPSDKRIQVHIQGRPMSTKSAMTPAPANYNSNKRPMLLKGTFDVIKG